MKLVIHGNPRPAPRPRGSAGQRSYNPKWYEDLKDDAIKQLKLQYRGEPMTGTIALSLVYYRKDYTKADVDNLAKLTMDAMSQQTEMVKIAGKKRKVVTYPGIYIDDNQIIDLRVRKRVDKSSPRVEIEIERADG